MALLGNIIWIIFGGLLASLAYIIGGFIFCLTIIGIPFGLQSIKIGIATFAPFGKVVVTHEQSFSLLRIFFNVIWLICFGWFIALTHLIFGIILMITVIGIPFGLQHFKLIPISIYPFGISLERIQETQTNRH